MGGPLEPSSNLNLGAMMGTGVVMTMSSSANQSQRLFVGDLPTHINEQQVRAWINLTGVVEKITQGIAR